MSNLRLLAAAGKQKTYRCDTCNKTFTSQVTFQEKFRTSSFLDISVTTIHSTVFYSGCIWAALQFAMGAGWLHQVLTIFQIGCSIFLNLFFLSVQSSQDVEGGMWKEKCWRHDQVPCDNWLWNSIKLGFLIELTFCLAQSSRICSFTDIYINFGVDEGSHQQK